jgi:predicted tellurium resistance membrane protein TerC
VTSKLQIYFYGMILGALLMIIPAYNYFFLFGAVYEFFELIRYIGFFFFLFCGIHIAISVIKTLLNK